MLDADPQQSSSHWYNIAEGQAPFALVTSSQNIQHELRNIATQYSHVLVDCPPAADCEQVKQALRVADLAIIPVQPSPVDIWATIHAESEISLARKHNPALQALLVINQFESRTQLSKLMRRALAELSLPTAKTQVKRRAVYRNSFLEGRTVHGMGFKGETASSEIFQLLEEMEKKL